MESLRFRPPRPGGHKLARNASGKPIQRCTLCRQGQATTHAYDG